MQNKMIGFVLFFSSCFSFFFFSSQKALKDIMNVIAIKTFMSCTVTFWTTIQHLELERKAYMYKGKLTTIRCLCVCRLCHLLCFKKLLTAEASQPAVCLFLSCVNTNEFLQPRLQIKCPGLFRSVCFYVDQERAHNPRLCFS